MKLIFDIETDGLLRREGEKPELTRIWCISAFDVDQRIKYFYGPDQIEDGLKLLEQADELIGHNIIAYDLPALRKVHNWKYQGAVLDTLVVARVLWADRGDRDGAWLARDPDCMPRKYRGSHSLASYGFRLGVLKQEYEGGYEEYNEEMAEYCRQDVQVTLALYEQILKKDKLDKSWVTIEHEVARIIQEQTDAGIGFDVNAATDLYGRLCSRRDELVHDLESLFPDWEVREPFTPKVNRPDLGYEKGVPTEKVTTVQFNPNSRDHIADRLINKYGWQPQAFTPEGKPRVDEVVLDGLDYPEAKLLAESFLVAKRIGQLAEGQNAWLKMERNGRIHGSVNTNGAVTGRMTHSRPNMAQVPSVRAPYGRECRELFIAGPRNFLVGCDADALELRCLAHYMAYYDDGAYVDVVLNGDKASGTDTHSRNAAALGCDRDTAKTWFYAFIYGAGNKKLGSILGGSAKQGAASKKKFFEALPALKQLVEDVQTRALERGYLCGLDGRPLYVRSSHAALNTLLQAAGAVIMKLALVLAQTRIEDRDADFVANVHDEWQVECRKGIAQDVGQELVGGIREAGARLGLRCPMDAQFSVGRTWADTH